MVEMVRPTLTEQEAAAFLNCKRPTPSALARNDPTLLTKPDPGNPPAAGMISPSLPSTCGQRRGCVRWVTLSEQKWVILAERRGPTLTAWRRRRVGPPFYQIGRLIRYSPQDLVEYLDSRRRDYAA
jgi:hypothetical protein